MQNTVKQNYPGSVASYDTPTLGQEMKRLICYHATECTQQVSITLTVDRHLPLHQSLVTWHSKWHRYLQLPTLLRLFQYSSANNLRHHTANLSASPEYHSNGSKVKLSAQLFIKLE